MKSSKSDIQKSVVALILVAAMGSYLGVLARYLNADFSILQQTYIRTFVALLVAILIFSKSIRWRQLSGLSSMDWWSVIARGVGPTLIGGVLFTKAVQLTPLSDAMFIGALPTTPILAFILLREKITPWKLALIFISAFGAILVGITNYHHLLSWNPGDLLIMLSDVGFGMGYIVSRKYRSKRMNDQETTTLSLLFGALSVLIVSLVIGEGAPPLRASLSLWDALIAAGLTIALSTLFINYAFKHVGGVEGGNLITLETVFGLVFGYLFYSELPGWRSFIGGCIIVASVIAMNILSGRENNPTVISDN